MASKWVPTTLGTGVRSESITEKILEDGEGNYKCATCDYQSTNKFAVFAHRAAHSPMKKAGKIYDLTLGEIVDLVEDLKAENIALKQKISNGDEMWKERALAAEDALSAIKKAIM